MTDAERYEVEELRHDARLDAEDYESRCPACGDVIDYCQGHGEIGDPQGFAILQAHDDGDHSGCRDEEE